jgi:hypothetical protein
MEATAVTTARAGASWFIGVRFTRSRVLRAALLAGALLVTAPAARAAGPEAVPTPCADATAAGYAHCDSQMLVSATTHAPVQPNVHLGYGPDDLQSAYMLTGPAASRGADQTVAIVDAYDDPNAESDLATYRSSYGLPACTTANGCFKKVNQSGGSTPPAPDIGWATEISLDLDVVSATCPRCKILLVEATSNSFLNLSAAVDRAATMGATQISNSYGGSETGTSFYASHFSHSGIAITASSGDSGFAAGPEAPAAFPSVTAVGGTSLCRSGSAGCSFSARGWSESAWAGAGSGCSTTFTKPSWQHDVGCAKRTIADVSAVADPATGVAVYDTYGYAGWLVFGGTSASAPLVAGWYALIGSSVGGDGASWAYAHPSRLFDVTSGTNGAGCSPAYLCAAGAGFDGPTGLGTPNGIPGSAPTASFTVTPTGPLATGTVVAFDGSGSTPSDPAGAIIRYEWDLDGNGSYETDTGSVPLTTHVYLLPGQVTVGLRVTDNTTATGATTKTISTVTVPANTARPTIVGVPVENSALTCVDGIWTGAPTGYTHQWTRDGADIAGATNVVYTVLPADVAHQLACRVGATNVAGTTQSTSDPVTPSARASGGGSGSGSGTGTGGGSGVGTGGGSGSGTGGGTGGGGSSTGSGSTTGGGTSGGGASGAGIAGASGTSGGGAAGGSSGGPGYAGALTVSLGTNPVSVARSGRGRVRARCVAPIGSTCTVRFTLEARTVSAGRVSTRRIGSGSGNVPGTGEAVLPFKVTHVGRSLLRSNVTLSATVTGTVDAGGGAVAFSQALRLKLR